MKKASEIKVGECCRYQNKGCVRVELPHYLDDTDGMVGLMTSDYQLHIVPEEEEVGWSFGYEVQPPEDNRHAVHHIGDVIKSVDSMWELNSVERTWEARMKELAEERLKIGTDEVIDDLDALDYIWKLHGDYCITGDQVYHSRALDYYLGRKVEHVWGTGTLMKIAHEFDDERLVKQRAYFNEERVWISDKSKEFNLPDRGIHYGIAIKFPCQCGKVEYDMFAIPGVHTGGFAYLVDETTDSYLDVRNQCRVCDECGPKVRHQLDLIDQFSNVGQDEEGRAIGNCRYCEATGVDIHAHAEFCKKEDDDGEGQN